MKEICTLLVKLHIIFSRMQRVNQHARPSIIQHPPVVIRCVHWTMQMWVLPTWIKAQGLAIVIADVVGESINRRGGYHVTVSSPFSARFLYGFPYRFQRAWTVLYSMKHPLDVVRVGAWNSLRNSFITWRFFLPFLHDFCMDFHTDSRGHGRSYVARNIR